MCKNEISLSYFLNGEAKVLSCYSSPKCGVITAFLPQLTLLNFKVVL